MYEENLSHIQFILPTEPRHLGIICTIVHFVHILYYILYTIEFLFIFTLLAGKIDNIVRQWAGCPRKWFLDFRRKTEFFIKYMEFRGIPRNFAEFRGIFTVKIGGMSWTP